MSILSDATIRSLCELPAEIFDHKIYQQLLDSRGGVWPAASHAIERVKREMITHATRPPSAEERSAFKPMIVPFSPTLIREVVDKSSVEKRNAALVDWAKANPDLTPTHDTLSQLENDYPDIARKIISKGITSYGYDVSLTEDIKLFTNINSAEIDPKRFDQERCLVQADVHTDVDGARFVRIPPHSFMLGSTVEYFCIPRDIMVVCLGKSTYARCGAIVNTTPIEPEFEGNIVIEISNSTPLPMRIYLNEGIAQFLFLKGDKPCETSYKNRGGKYQGQVGVTIPKV